jgi:hypothetical protein
MSSISVRSLAGSGSAPVAVAILDVGFQVGSTPIPVRVTQVASHERARGACHRRADERAGNTDVSTLDRRVGLGVIVTLARRFVHAMASLRIRRDSCGVRDADSHVRCQRAFARGRPVGLRRYGGAIQMAPSDDYAVLADLEPIAS